MQAEVARGRTQRDERRTQVQQLLAPKPNMPAVAVPVEVLAPRLWSPLAVPQEACPEAKFSLNSAPMAGCTEDIAEAQA